MEFSPSNQIVQLCIQGMAMEEKGLLEEARMIFLQAWENASENLEKFISAYYLSRHQPDVADRLHWLKTAVALALQINIELVESAFPVLYSEMATCYEDLGLLEEAKTYHALSASGQATPSDKGPFYHGTKADLQIGDQLVAGGLSNFKADFTMNHIYFTASAKGAGLAAALAKGDQPERVYIVEPTGAFENDPNLTNHKFPGNLTRSYRSREPLTIIGELTDWDRQTPGELQALRARFANQQGEIIN
jgi:hypothetical protein